MNAVTAKRSVLTTKIQKEKPDPEDHFRTNHLTSFWRQDFFQMPNIKDTNFLTKFNNIYFDD